MTAAMNELQQMSERDLGRVLDKNQVKRLKEIQLQMEGPFAVLRPDVAEKLELGEDQVAQIQEIRNESNQAPKYDGRQSPDVRGSAEKPERRQPARSECGSGPGCHR